MGENHIHINTKNANMQILNSSEYINEKLDIKPVTKGMLADIRKVPQESEKAAELIRLCNLKYNGITKRYDGEVVKITDEYLVDGKFPFKFGEIKRTFDCSNCDTLETLEGAPLHTTRFVCNDCPKLKTLEGAPQTVDGLFDCNHCINLESFIGAPKSVGNFLASSTNVKTLEGAPQRTDGFFDCSYSHSLETTKGAPQYVGGDFDLSKSEKLEKIEDCPSYIGSEFNLEGCDSLSLTRNDVKHIQKALHGGRLISASGTI